MSKNQAHIQGVRVTRSGELFDTIIEIWIGHLQNEQQFVIELDFFEVVKRSFLEIVDGLLELLLDE